MTLWEPNLTWARAMARWCVNRTGASLPDIVDAITRAICRPNVPWTAEDREAVVSAAIDSFNRARWERIR